MPPPSETGRNAAANEDSSSAVVELRPQDSVYLREEKLLASPPPMALMARDLAAFFRISNAIGEIRELEPLKHRLLELICEVVPASRGAIVLVGETSEESRLVAGWHRDPDCSEPVPVQRGLLRKVLRSSEAVLTTESPDGESGPSCSILCLPLVVLDRILGAVYLDSGPDGVPFAKDQLEFLSAISGMLAVALENVRNIEWLERENRRLRSGTDLKHDMVGNSAAMQKVYRFISKVAPTDATVLLRGESGTGKELCARAIHMNSARSQRPFVAINCATLTEPLLESELFGHEKGSFTGAVRQKKGKLELADGGTVFLDELGDLAPALQAKLLRVLQESEFERVGGTTPIQVDIRLIAATNKSLEEAIQARTFREDLYYRLNVVSITIPPLRERYEDISLLANHFAIHQGVKANRRVLGVSPEAEEVLVNYPWPGNIRELENAVERAVVLGTEEFLQAEDLPENILQSGTARSAYSLRYHEALRQFKRDLILKALRRSQGNFTRAGESLGIHPNYLHRLVTNLDMREEVEEMFQS